MRVKEARWPTRTFAAPQRRTVATMVRGHQHFMYSQLSLGYCPPSQVPFTHAHSPEPPTCHMALNPCPTTAAYQCVYSPEKQNSYCCAPIDTTALADRLTGPGGFARHYHHHKIAGLSPYNSTPAPHNPFLNRESTASAATLVFGPPSQQQQVLASPMLIIGGRCSNWALWARVCARLD